MAKKQETIKVFFEIKNKIVTKEEFTQALVDYQTDLIKNNTIKSTSK